MRTYREELKKVLLLVVSKELQPHVAEEILWKTYLIELDKASPDAVRYAQLREGVKGLLRGFV